MISDDQSDFTILREQIEIEIQAAQKYYENRLYHRALQRYEQALRFTRRLNPEELDSLGDLIYKVELDRATIFLTIENPYKVIEICTQLQDCHYCVSEDGTTEIDRLLGSAYFMACDYAHAIPLLDRVEKAYLLLLENDRDRTPLIRAAHILRTNALAHLYRLDVEGAIDKLYLARELFLDAQAITCLADCDTLLGELSLYCEEFRSARFHIVTALSLNAKTGQNLKMAQCLWLQAKLERVEGNRDRALAHYQEAKQLYLAHNLTHPVILILIEMGNYHGDLDEYDLAKNCFIEAEDLSQNLTESYLERIMLRLRKFEFEARRSVLLSDVRDGFRELVRILRDQQSPFMLHNTLVNMLMTELEEGDISLVEEWVQELNSFWISLRQQKYPLYPVMNARLLFRADKFREAEQLLLQSIGERQHRASEHFTCLFYQELADIQRHELNDAVQAQESLKAAVSIVESDQFLFKIPFLKELYLRFYRDPFSDYGEFLLETDSLSTLLSVIERKILFDQRRAFGIDVAHRLMPEGLSISLQKKWDSLGTISKRLLHNEGMIEYCLPIDFQRKKLFHEHEADFEIITRQEDCPDECLESLLDKRANDYKELSALRIEIINEDSRWKNILGLGSERLKLNEMSIDRGVAFLAYMVEEDKSFGILVANGEPIHAFTIPLPRAQLNEMIGHVRLEISNAKYPRKFRAKLWELLLEPVIDRIPEKIERLVIVPHDVLWRLPLHLMERQGEYLWDRYVIEYIPSFHVWETARSKGDERTRKSFHCFAHIVPGVSDQLTDLSALENLSHSKKSSDEFTLISEALSTQKFWQNARKANILIVGTRLAASASVPSSMWFNLGGGDTPSHEASITLDDIMEKKCPETDVVIFPSVTIDPVGQRSFQIPALLYRAWLLAGVPTMLYSLWSADPVAVSLFITQFLQNKSKMNVAQALRAAAFTLRASGDFASVRDWAPLTFCGYGGALCREGRRGFLFRR